MSASTEYDVVFVGCGFGTVGTLPKFQKLGLNCHVYERNERSGGVWSENAYPGARVDSDAPLYQMFDRELWTDFDFVQRYPDRSELQRYFDHLDSKIHFSDNTTYSTNVTGAVWDDKEGKWTVELHSSKGRGLNGTEVGQEAGPPQQKIKCRWFIPAIGFAAKAYIPKIPGMDKFKGVMHHSAYWPEKGVDLKGKKIAVIGTGASGIQIIQEAADDAAQLTTYQRTPNLALPMQQKPIAAEANDGLKQSGHFDEAFGLTNDTFAGFSFGFPDRKFKDTTPEEREEYWGKLYEDGGFRFWLANYKETYYEPEANRASYDYWRDRVRNRIKDPRKKDILAPMEPPHHFGCKRPSLEQRYFEIYNSDHVDVIDIAADPISEITETSIVLKSGASREFDVIILATGFDAVNGSLGNMNIRNAQGETIGDHWKNGLKTSCGVAMCGFPNLFFLYGPQAPTAFSNGPTTCQVQSNFLGKLFKIITEKKINRIEPTKEAEQYWTEETNKYWNESLFAGVKSWYNGANIPGKRVEALNYIGGMPKYIKELDDSMKNELHSWNVQTAVM